MLDLTLGMLATVARSHRGFPAKSRQRFGQIRKNSELLYFFFVGLFSATFGQDWWPYGRIFFTAPIELFCRIFSHLATVLAACLLFMALVTKN